MDAGAWISRRWSEGDAVRSSNPVMSSGPILVPTPRGCAVGGVLVTMGKLAKSGAWWEPLVGFYKSGLAPRSKKVRVRVNEA